MHSLHHRTNRRGLWTIAVVGAFILQLVAVSASRAQEPPKGPPSALTSAELDQNRLAAATQFDQNELDAAAQSIRTVASADIEHYYETGIDIGRQTVVVWRKGGDLGLTGATKARYAANALGSPVQYRDAPFSKAEEQIIQNSVLAQYTELKDRGIIITLIGSLQAGGPLIIHYSAKGATPTLEILTSIGITTNWPEAALKGEVEFKAGGVTPFD